MDLIDETKKPAATILVTAGYDIDSPKWTSFATGLLV